MKNSFFPYNMRILKLFFMHDDILEYDIYGNPIYPENEETSSESQKVTDAFGNELANGDTVQLTQDLKVK